MRYSFIRKPLIMKILWVVLSIAAVLLLGFFIEHRILLSRKSQVQSALESGNLSEALDPLLSIARPPDLRNWKVATSLAYKFWLQANTTQEPIRVDREKLTETTDSVLAYAWERASVAIAEGPQRLSVHQLDQVITSAIKGKLYQERARMLLARAAMFEAGGDGFEAGMDGVKVLNTDGVKILKQVADFDPGILEITPGAILGLSFLVREEYPKVIELRKARLPNPKSPLTTDSQSLLALEVLATHLSEGSGKAAELARKYLNQNLFTVGPHPEAMRHVAENEIFKIDPDVGTGGVPD